MIEKPELLLTKLRESKGPRGWEILVTGNWTH